VTIGLAVVASRLDVMPAVIPSLAPHFDRVFILVDGGKAEPGLFPWVTGSGYEWGAYHFGHEAYRCFNGAAALCGTDWVMQLDSDEDLTGAEGLRDLVAWAESAGQNCIGFPRRNWTDLARTDYRRDHFPDHQWRLRRNYGPAGDDGKACYNRWRVHPDCLAANQLWLPEHGPFYLEHFAFALRSGADWHHTNLWYRELLASDERDGRPCWAGKDGG
jgi:hypothetical protein